MPITLDRMANLLQAAKDYQQALAEARSAIREALDRQDGNRSRALSDILNKISPENLLKDPEGSPRTITEEEFAIRYAQPRAPKSWEAQRRLRGRSRPN